MPTPTEEKDFNGKDEKGNWVPVAGVADQYALQSGNFKFGPVGNYIVIFAIDNDVVANGVTTESGRQSGLRHIIFSAVLARVVTTSIPRPAT